jgi:hypothetical protein
MDIQTDQTDRDAISADNGNSEEQQPTVFMSYSHDSPQHKQWVATLAARLREEGGANVIIDQWDTEPGDDLVKFMEKGVRDANRVLMVCTTSYVQKANNGRGGVGYEAMVVTGELVRDLGTSKFIPVIPPENADAAVPTCVSTRRFVDMRDAERADAGFDEIVETLHHLGALRKPAIGLHDRFRVVEYAATASEVADREGQSSLDSPLDFHANAAAIIRRGDYLEWQRFVRTTRRECLGKLVEFREAHEKARIANDDEMREMVLEAVSVYAPLVAIALAGVESGTERFRNQTAVLSDILNPSGWVRSGRTILVDLPKALAFIYQALNGAMCVQSRQFDLAATLARSPIVAEFRKENAYPLFARTDINGWIKILGQNMTAGLRVILGLPERWDWLRPLFEDEETFGSCVSCYYILLMLTELVSQVRDKTPLEEGSMHFHVPPVFWFTTPDMARKALQRLLNEAEQVRSLWIDQGVSGKDVADRWDVLFASWAKSEATFMFNVEDSMNILKNPVRNLL